jgi:hypothetical protein
MKLESAVKNALLLMECRYQTYANHAVDMELGLDDRIVFKAMADEMIQGMRILKDESFRIQEASKHDMESEMAKDVNNAHMIMACRQYDHRRMACNLGLDPGLRRVYKSRADVMNETVKILKERTFRDAIVERYGVGRFMAGDNE